MQQFTLYRIPPRHDADRVDRILAAEFAYRSRSQWQDDISKGAILCNGERVMKHHKRLRAGDILTSAAAPAPEPEVNRSYRPLYEDQHLIAVDKPANLPTHPSGIFYRHTLLTLLQEEYGVPLYPIHRLDRETSGVIIFGKTPDAASAVHRSFHSVEKEYWAIVHGRPSSESFSVDLPIDNNPGAAMQSPEDIQDYTGKPAKTFFEMMMSLGEYSMIRAIPATGRRHQIRIHLLHAGLPIVGDKIYCADRDFYTGYIASGYSIEFASRLPFHRCALHAHRLDFWHPWSEQRMTLSAPLPDDMKSFIIRESE